MTSEIHYHVEDEGEGPPLVLLHGFTGSAKNWEPLLPAFSSNFRVLRVDLLGHGATDAPYDPLRYDMASVAADLRLLLDKKFDQPVHLLGYSMGGRLALYLALNVPDRVRSLVLESASPGLETPQERAERVQKDWHLAERIERDGVETFVDYWELIPLFASQKRLSQPVRDRLRAQRLQNRSIGLANSLRGMGTGVQPSLWPRLKDLSVPVLLLAGALDEKFVAINERMAAAIPRTDYQVIPDAGHTIHLEKPDRFTEVVLDFLKRV